ncbi:MAG TPA: SDR family oxidoreductase [Longimicrobium sp.]|nr:SDR family oxidoreductase [Longimicrobium sp.]
MSRRVFITGGASGLGRGLAERYARAGCRVCIGDVNDARGAETVASLGGEAFYLRCDVRREEDLRAVAAELETRWGGVDVVVNNAGVAGAGAIEDVTLDDWAWIIDINLLGVVRGCRVFTPVFKRQRRGQFINVASMAGLLDVPLMSSYNATKAAVVSLSETLQNELEADGIRVSVVCPSFFRTNLNENVRAADPALRATVDRLLERGALPADEVIDRIFRGVEAGDFYVLPHPQGVRAWRMKRLLPRGAYRAIVRKEYGRMRRSMTRPRAEG